jgi:NAD(P)-dependent dehydrogenase (short-subunit alcohol dehydrogenase family)
MLEHYRKLLDFSGKTVVVTGGAGLLGREIITSFCAYRALAVMADVNQGMAESLLEPLRRLGAEVEFFYWDMSDVADIPRQVAALEERFGPVAAWVNCAYPRTPDWGARLEEVTVAGWQRNVDMHLNGYCLTSNEVAKRMAARGGGAIVNIGSIQGHVAPDFRVYEGTAMTSPAAYTAIKGGIIMYSKYLASYFGKDQVRVNVVSPGGIFNNQPEPFLTRYSQRTCLGRLARTQEVAIAVLFLASEAASYITGIDLLVDGGLTAL